MKANYLNKITMPELRHGNEIEMCTGLRAIKKVELIGY